MLDERGTVAQCTDTVPDLLGWSAQEVRGRPMTALAVSPGAWQERFDRAERVEFSMALRHRDGASVAVDIEVVPLPAGAAIRHLVFAVPCADSRRQAEDQALVRALLSQDRVGVVIHDTDLAIRRLNLEPRRLGLDQPRREDGRVDARPEDVLVPEDAAAINEQMRRVLETGEPLIYWEHSCRWRIEPETERTSALSMFRLEDPQGRAIGVAAVLTDVTEHHAARQRLDLLHAAAARLGQSLEMTRNAEELTGVLVPGFADLASVDLSEPVLEGGDSARLLPDTLLRRIAVASPDGVWPADIYQRGDTVRARESEVSRNLREGGTVLASDLAAFCAGLELDDERRRLLWPSSAVSALFVPLFGRGHVLGVLGLWRNRGRAPFTAADVPLIEEIGSRAALSLDNARRYSRERRVTEALQRSLLPPPVVETAATQTSGAYVPASTAAGTGGTWYDVIRLSGVRTAFVVGRVAGHGVHAAGAMGRLRSAVQTLADLDPPPEELLSHLDDLVTRMGEDDTHQGIAIAGSLRGATCLYATYDPVTGQCLVAAAGHPVPVVAHRHTGTVDEVSLRPVPALGRGSEPFETTELLLQPGDVLAFHSGPVGGDREYLRESARAAAHTDEPLTDITARLLDRLRKEPRSDDLALLLTRVDRVPPSRTAFWQLSADPSLVAHARALASAQLAEWGLEDVAFTTELIVSELVTNAIRYASGPIGLRLIKNRRLVCEVSDPSQSQPRLRRARLADEGGRGLFLIAQLAHRWGSRYTPDGKTIWTEQYLEPGGA
ncbi:ATP-binding SpoIIE family protein phosphatase [Streptomyces sp. NRRL S-813]|uniref:ATP-binding SpoIIE family protein phosphatase n=1 Tax=Streptomyces sp. NRRL S-813 TaxID=1463919 RepID=UPI00131B34B1|nr:SpoIIE family protein phosphatase [Streptomyces sp. NRRL S-813]